MAQQYYINNNDRLFAEHQKRMQTDPQYAEQNNRKTSMNRSDYMVNNYDKQYGNYGRFADMAEARQAPQAAYSQQFRDMQGSYLRDMRREAQGNGIGQALVRSQAQGAADRNMSQQMGMAASARPGQTAMAGRNAALAGAIGSSAVGEQASQAGMQMALGAQAQYGQALAGARDQDENMNRFNVGAQQNQYQLNDNAALHAYDSRMGLSGMQQQGSQAYQNARLGNKKQQSGFGKFLDYAIPMGRDLGMAYATGGTSMAVTGPPGSSQINRSTGQSPSFGNSGQLQAPQMPNPGYGYGPYRGY